MTCMTNEKRGLSADAENIAVVLSFHAYPGYNECVGNLSDDDGGGA